MKKRFLFPIAFCLIVVVSIALGLDGLFMIINAPAGLLIVGIYVVFGIQITSIWPALVFNSLIAFLLGYVVDIILGRIRGPHDV